MNELKSDLRLYFVHVSVLARCEGLSKDLLRDQLVFKLSDNDSEALVVLALLVYGLLETLYNLIFVSYLLPQVQNVLPQRCDIEIEAVYLFFVFLVHILVVMLFQIELPNPYLQLSDPFMQPLILQVFLTAFIPILILSLNRFVIALSQLRAHRLKMVHL